jgi:hypothetical protein
MATKLDKHITMLDFERLKAQSFSSLKTTSLDSRPDELHRSQNDFQSKETNKRKASPIQRRARKIVKSS